MGRYPVSVEYVVVATDSDGVLAEIEAAIGSTEVEIERVHSGREVRQAVINTEPDLVILDMQIGSMGGIAACHDLRLEIGAGRLAPQPILMLLDREADVFLAARSDADGWLIKPLDPRRISRAVSTLIAGGSFTEGPDMSAAAS